MLQVCNVSVRYGDRNVVDSLSFHVRPEQWLMLVGPNGAGKSTVVRAVMQAAPYTGQILLDGQDVRSMKPRQRARFMGVLSQSHFMGYSFTVEEVVRMARYAHTSGIFSGSSREDDAAAEEALLLTGLTAQRQQSVLTLSGGELQRTFLAQVFAQQPRLLLLDEPTNHLDLIYQKQVFTLLSRWLQTPGRAVVSVVHDLSLAKTFGTDALLLHRGKAVACGAAGDVLCSEHLDPVYDMDVALWMRHMLSQWDP